MLPSASRSALLGKWASSIFWWVLLLHKSICTGSWPTQRYLKHSSFTLVSNSVYLVSFQTLTEWWFFRIGHLRFGKQTHTHQKQYSKVRDIQHLIVQPTNSSGKFLTKKEKITSKKQTSSITNYINNQLKFTRMPQYTQISNTSCQRQFHKNKVLRLWP